MNRDQLRTTVLQSMTPEEVSGYGDKRKRETWEKAHYAITARRAEEEFTREFELEFEDVKQPPIVLSPEAQAQLERFAQAVDAQARCAARPVVTSKKGHVAIITSSLAVVAASLVALAFVNPKAYFIEESLPALHTRCDYHN